MNSLGSYMFNPVGRVVDNLHENSLTAARSLELQDEKDFGKTNIKDVNGRRWSELSYRDPNSSCGNPKMIEEQIPLGVTAAKIKDLQTLEFKHKIAKIEENAPKSGFSLFHALGSFITPSLRTGSSAKLAHDLKDGLVGGIRKRSQHTCLDQEYNVADNQEYLENERIVQKEWSRLVKKSHDVNELNVVIAYAKDEVVMNGEINRTAKDLIQLQSEKTITNGKYVLTGLAVASILVAGKCFSSRK